MAEPFPRVRAERPGDAGAIRRIHELAFGRPDEANLVDALRGSDAWRADLSLVDDELTGHVLFSVAALDTGVPILALAPVGVLPEHQGRGTGSALIRAGLERARGTQ